MRAITVALAISVLLGGCSESSTRPEPLPYTVVTPDVWAGQDVLITSPGFAPPHEIPSVSLDGVRVEARVVDDTTLAVVTPSSAGTYELRVSSPAVVDVPTNVVLRGFLARETGPSMFGHLDVIPGPPAVFGHAAAGVIRWDIAGRHETPVPGIQHDGTCVYGIGASYDPTHLVVHSASCPTETGWTLWSVDGAPAQLDTVPYAGRNITVELAAKKTLHSYHHEFYLIDCDTTPCRWEFVTAEQVSDAVFSPARDRLVPLGAYHGAEGLPIVEPTTATVAYRIAQLVYAGAAAFSPDGDTLFTAGVATTGIDAPYYIVRARARDGVVDTVIEVSPRITAMAVDPAHPWLYILFDLPASLDVWDRRTMARIASIPIPNDPCMICFWDTKILPSPPEHRLYMASTRGAEATANAGYEAQLFVFDTPP